MISPEAIYAALVLVMIGLSIECVRSGPRHLARALAGEPLTRDDMKMVVKAVILSLLIDLSFLILIISLVLNIGGWFS